MKQNRRSKRKDINNMLHGQYNTNNLAHKKEVRFQDGGTHQRRYVEFNLISRIEEAFRSFTFRCY